MLLVALLNKDKVADALVLTKLVLSQPVPSDKAFGPHVDDELAAYSLLTLHFNGSSHLLYDLFANWEAKSRALLVPGGVLV